MRYYELITEGRSVEIDAQHAKTLLETEFSDAVNADPIYRGNSNLKTDYYLASSNNHDERLAANTSNYMNLITGNLPSWSAFPKRSKSFICSTNSFYAKGYGGGMLFGTAYRVYPKNGTKIGVCSARDFWDSFKVLKVFDFDNVSSFNYFISLMDASQWKYEDMKRSINAFGSKIKNDLVGLSTRDQNRTKGFMEYQGTLFDFFAEMLDPIKNDFELKTPDTFTNMPNDVEVWTEGPILLIREKQSASL